MNSAIAHLERLVGFATVSRDSNLELIDYVRAHLAGLAIESRIVASEDGRKANLFATIGPPERPGVVLSGHTDVVPCEGQVWTSDPFALRRENGRLYGRGTADMKGFIACCLAMASETAGRPLATPIHFAFSYDEEVGCIGVRRLLDMLATLPVRPRFCIVGEPTLMQVATAHKGKASWRVVAHGLEGHSSLAPLSVNAIHLAVDLIGRIRALQDEVATSGRRDGDYDVPYTTIHVGRFAGGETMNIVPNRASFDFEIRYLPRDDAAGMFERIETAANEIVEIARARFAGARLTFEPLVSYPALDTAPDEDVVAFMKSLTGANATTKISFGTEGGLYQQRLNVPSVVCGPGAIMVAHKPDEYVETAQLDACTAFLSRLVDKLSQS